MLLADKISVWRSRYRITVDGREVAIWDSTVWKRGGGFELDGRRYEVRGNAWGNRFAMADASGMPVASADRVGRRRWTVEAAGQAYEFRRASMWRSEQELVAGGNRIGSIRRAGFGRSHITAELPGLPLPVQVFVLGVVITMWNAQAAAAASAGGSG
jgi:hypothetical protein